MVLQGMLSRQNGLEANLRELIEAMAVLAQEYPDAVTQNELARRSGVPSSRIEALCDLAQEAGLLERGLALGHSCRLARTPWAVTLENLYDCLRTKESSTGARRSILSWPAPTRGMTAVIVAQVEFDVMQAVAAQLRRVNLAQFCLSSNTRPGVALPLRPAWQTQWMAEPEATSSVSA